MKLATSTTTAQPPHFKAAKVNGYDKLPNDAASPAADGPVENSPSSKEPEFMRLYVHNERRVKGYVMALVPNWDDAAEVISETTIRLWEQFDPANPPRDFGAWACTVAHYMVLAYRKKASRNKIIFSDKILELVAAPAEISASVADQRDRSLKTCIERLTERNRDLVERCYSGEQSIVQVAEELGRTEGSVRMALTRVRQWLHRCIERELRKEDRR